MRVSAALLLALVALPAAALAAAEKTKIGLLNLAPLASRGPDGKPTGFEVAVAEKACELAGLECDLVLIDAVADRIPALLNGTVDALFAALSVTDERRQQVQFVTPFYYATGASLFALKEKAAGLGSWEGIKGQKVCTTPGFYLNDALESKYGAELVQVADAPAAARELISGGCLAVPTDSADLSVIQPAAEQGATVVVTAAPAIDVSPYGAAVRPDDEALAVKLSGAIAQGMLSAGSNSTIFDLENEYIISAGGEPAPYLADLADAVTYMVPQEE